MDDGREQRVDCARFVFVGGFPIYELSSEKGSRVGFIVAGSFASPM